jgi:flagellar basal-body rod modification protein FlgD
MTALNPASGAVSNTAVNTQANNSFTQLSGNFDTFIKLLTAQVQYQDPLEPTDASKFTEQLVQYSTVEQQIGTNSKLDEVIASLAVQGGNAYINYIGRKVDVDSNNVVLKAGNGEVGYDLSDVAGSVKIEVYNKSNALVRTLEGGTTLGRHTVTWDGKNADGALLADGLYTFKVKALRSDGTAITNIRPFTVGVVTGVEADAKGALLDLGGYTINPAQVYAVRGI